LKRALVYLALVLALMSYAFAQEAHHSPYVAQRGDGWAVWHYFGQITDPTDTVWHPGIVPNDSVPGVWGIDLSPYKYFGFEFDILQADTTHIDSLLVDIWTGYYGAIGSVTVAIPTDSITNSILVDSAATAPLVRRYVLIADTAITCPFWFQKYAWGRIRSYVNSDNETDTTFAGATEGDLWSEAGDSLIDWNTTNADGIFWKMFTTTASWDSFAYITGKDSLLALSMNKMAAATNPGVIDSVVFGVALWESLTVVAPDTLRLGIAFGDSTEHHYDSLDIGVKGSGVLWATQQAVTSAAEARDTLEFTFTTDPYGNPWTRTTLDSCILILDPVHIDTTSAGAAATLCIYDILPVTYHNRSNLFPAVKYRMTFWLKE
jgi:hypothetical protein